MPRHAKTRFVRKKKQSMPTTEPLQCCVVCYCTFHPFPVQPSRWASSMTKVFYYALNIPPFQSGGDEEGDEDDVLLSLPYCPECHSKISLMFSLYSQLEKIQNQYACIRNEIAFIVVETIDQNCRNGPMDFIRQQIYEKWQGYHAEESSKEDYRDAIGLDAILALNYGMNDISDSFGGDDNGNDANSENEVEESDPTNASGSAQNFQSATNVMEVEYNENTGFDQRTQMRNGSPLAPNAVHVISKRHSKRTSTAASTASLLAIDEQNLAMHRDADGQEFLPDNNGDTNIVDTPVKKPGRGRPVGSKQKMPRLVPMNSAGGRRKLGKSSLGLNVNAQVNRAGNFRGRGGRGRGRGFRASRFVPKRNPSVAYNNFHTDFVEQDEDVYDFNSNEDQNEYVSTPSKRGRGLPQLLTKPLRGRPPGKTSPYSKQNAALRYPKRHSSRPQKLQNEYFEDREFKTEPGLNETIKKEDSEAVYACVLCPKFYTNPGRLLRHESLCHPSLKSIHCEVCGKGFSSRLTHRRHVINLHPEVEGGPKICNVCGKSFLKQYSLDLHIKSHKSIQGRKGKRVSRRGQVTSTSDTPTLSSAMTTRTPRKNRDASASMSNGELLSNMTEFSSPENMRNSDLETSDYDPVGSAASDKESLTCGICGKAFPYRTLLNMHFLTHAARKSYKCDTCNITFSTYDEIKSHNDEAHRSKALPCFICGQEFVGAENLRRHQKVHEIKQERQEITESQETEN